MKVADMYDGMTESDIMEIEHSCDAVDWTCVCGKKNVGENERCPWIGVG